MIPQFKILIIDDNAIDQIVTKQLLKKKLNLTSIEVVSSGKDALVWLTNYKREKCNSRQRINRRNR